MLSDDNLMEGGQEQAPVPAELVEPPKGKEHQKRLLALMSLSQRAEEFVRHGIGGDAPGILDDSVSEFEQLQLSSTPLGRASNNRFKEVVAGVTAQTSAASGKGHRKASLHQLQGARPGRLRTPDQTGSKERPQDLKDKLSTHPKSPRK